MKDTQSPYVTTEDVEKMTPLEAMILARDIHLWHRDRRRTKRNIEWERVWVEMYERVISKLKENQT